jgi:hypothetical protein
MTKRPWILYAGDTLLLAALTLIGFATHGEADLSFLPRVAAIYFPLSISWFLLAPPLGLFQQETTFNSKQLWRPALSAFFAAQFAAVLRGLILNAPIIPVFAVVLGMVSAVGMVIWRGLYYLLNRTAKP